MTRRGHKQQLKELKIPMDSELTLSLRESQQQAKIVNYEEVKQRTLDYERRQEEEDYHGRWRVTDVGQLDSGEREGEGWVGKVLCIW